MKKNEEFTNSYTSALFTGPVEKLVSMLPYCEGRVIDRQIYSEMGIFICRGLLEDSECLLSLNKLRELGYLDANRNESNRVHLQVDRNHFESLWRSPKILDAVKCLIGPNISLYGFRFVVKDDLNRAAVFLHHDICYHKGGFERLSAFVALTPTNQSNGAMVFYPGTHHFGYLGDAGELNVNALQPGWPAISPNLNVGDVAFMHSALWHRSGENHSGELRVMSDIHYQPANDPSGICVVSGTSSAEYSFDSQKIEQAFLRSRVSRMIELEREVRKI